MLRVSVGLLIAGFIAIGLGFQDTFGVSFEEGRIVFLVSLALSILTFLQVILVGKFDSKESKKSEW